MVNAKGQFEKGEGGRKKGSKNKFTTLKQAYLDVFKALGDADWLLKFSKAYPVEFSKQLASMLPRKEEISGPEGKPIEFNDVKEKLVARLAGLADFKETK